MVKAEAYGCYIRLSPRGEAKFPELFLTLDEAEDLQLQLNSAITSLHEDREDATEYSMGRG